MVFASQRPGFRVSHDSGHTGLTGREAKDLALDRVPGAAMEDIWEFGRDNDDSFIWGLPPLSGAGTGVLLLS